MGNNCFTNSKLPDELKPLPKRNVGNKRFYSKIQEPFNPFKAKCRDLLIKLCS